MFSKIKTPLLILATLATLTFTLVSTGQYNPRGLSQPQASPPPAPEDVDEFAAQWPITVSSPQGPLTIYQPQMEQLVGDVLSARAAVAIGEGGGEPLYGVVWFDSRIATDRVSRVVQVLDVTITQTRIPDSDPATERALGDSVSRGMMQQPMALSLDQLLTMLESANLQGGEQAELVSDAPRIQFVEHPVIKVQYDGEPVLIPISNSPLQRVANTPFFVVMDPGSRSYFLKGGGVWYEAPNALGPFRRASRVPQEAIASADEFGYQDPQEPLPAEQLARLEIVTATEPTEIVWTDGPPQMATLPGTDLLYMSNTDSDVFMNIQSQRTFVLVSGRWYEAPGRNGPWAFIAPDQLPEDFRRIPPNSPCGDVLAHIPGTPQAQEAVADTYVPQTAAVSRAQFEQPTIEYDGDPRFEPVENTTALRYAVNSPQSIVEVDRRYYACYNAVWYVSDSPRGRWDLCTDVPEVIYTIPPSCPIYPVRYVYVYDHTPEYVYCGYTPGYVGSYVYRGAVVYGTGYRYRPWHGSHYYARPYTYGFGARYNSYVNNWGFSFGFRSGGGALWVGYSERSWARRDPWFGYGGYRPVVVRNDVRRDMFRRDYRYGDRDRGDRTNVTIINEQNTYVQNINVYQRRNDVRRIDPPQPRVSDVNRTRRAEERNNVLADREGRIYRRSGNNWEVRQDRQWRAEAQAPVAASPVRVEDPAQRITTASRTVAPEAPRVQRRPGTPARGGAERPVVRRTENAPQARGGRGQQPAADTTPEPARQAPTPDQPNRGDRGRGSANAEDRDERNAGGQGNRGDRARGPVAQPAPAPAERQPTPPAARGNEPDREPRQVDRTPTPPRGRGADAEPPAARPAPQAREDREQPPVNRGNARGQTADPQTPRTPGQPQARGDREAQPAAERIGRGAPPEPPQRVQPQARDERQDQPVNRGNARGQADRDDPPPARVQPQAREDRPDPPVNRGNARGQADRDARAETPPSRGNLSEVERDLRARQSAEDRLRNYQRVETPPAAEPARGGRSNTEDRDRPSPRPDPEENRGGRGRGGGNPDNRDRG